MQALFLFFLKFFKGRNGAAPFRPGSYFLCLQQPQPLSQPQPFQLFPPLPLPQQQNRMIRIIMIQRQLPPPHPQPLLLHPIKRHLQFRLSPALSAVSRYPMSLEKKGAISDMLSFTQSLPLVGSTSPTAEAWLPPLRGVRSSGD